MGIRGVAGKDGAVEAWYMEEERGHVLALDFEEVGHLRGDADLVLAAELEALGFFCDL